MDKKTMVYQSMMDEYKRNNQMQETTKEALNKLPKGSIQSVVRSGRTYYYLKYRENGKVIMKYIGNEKTDLQSIRYGIERRKTVSENLKKLKKEEKEIRRFLKI